MRRIMTVVLNTSMIACLAILSVCSASASQTTYLERMNSLTGNSFDDTYYLTREDFCTIVSKIFIDVPDNTTELPFEDRNLIKPENVPYLSALYENGAISGILTNGKLYMQPTSLITRQEAFTFLGRVLLKPSENEYKILFSDEEAIEPYAYTYVAWFAEKNIAVGYPDGSFKPSNKMTAGELASLTIRTVNFKRANDVDISTYSGTGNRGFLDGNNMTARFLLPAAVVFDSTTNSLIVFDTYNNCIRKIKSDTTETITGNIDNLDDNRFPKGDYLDGELKSALLNRPSGGAFNSKGELVIADSANNAIRAISNNTVNTLAGGEQGFADDMGKASRFNSPMALAIDKNDNIYVADTLNNCIRRIDKDGNVTTIAGMPEKEGFLDGNVNTALFRAPGGIAVTGDGSIIYVSDTGNHRIRKIENGVVSTVAGEVSESDEDGYPLGGFKNGGASQAAFNLPMGITIAGETLVVADTGNNMIRVVTDSGEVVTIAGDGEPNDKDGPALEAGLSGAMGVYFNEGTLYITDTNNNKIKRMPFDDAIY